MIRRLRAAYHRRFGYHARFHFAVAATLVVVAYAAVPYVARFVDALGGYNPSYYEPKDFTRTDWLIQQPISGLRGLSWGDVANVLLFAVLAVVWLAVVPARETRPWPPRR